MTAYLIIRAAVTDWDRYRAYMALTPAILAQYQGRFIARGGGERDAGRTGGNPAAGAGRVSEHGAGEGFLRVAGISGGKGRARWGVRGAVCGVGWCVEGRHDARALTT